MYNHANLLWFTVYKGFNETEYDTFESRMAPAPHNYQGWDEREPAQEDPFIPVPPPMPETRKCSLNRSDLA